MRLSLSIDDRPGAEPRRSLGWAINPGKGSIASSRAETPEAGSFLILRASPPSVQPPAEAGREARYLMDFGGTINPRGPHRGSQATTPTLLQLDTRRRAGLDRMPQNPRKPM